LYKTTATVVYSGKDPALAREIVPFVRDASFPVRTEWYTASRRLLDYLLMYVQEGTVVARVEGKEYLLRSGDFLLVQPGELHTLRGAAHTITPYLHFDVFYSPERARSCVVSSGQERFGSLATFLQPRLDEQAGILVPNKIVPRDSASFRDTMIKAIGIWQRRDLLGQLESDHLAAGLVLSLLQTYAETSSAPQARPEFLNWITSYMSLHLSERLTVTDLAARAGLSPSRFSRVFRDRFGSPPHHYLLHLRVQRAADLLQHTSLTMREVASRCGFADVHHFAKAFKRVTDETPGAYRSVNQPSR
jgi:AraC-like DNA-binding protein